MFFMNVGATLEDGWWNRCIKASATEDEAKQRLEAILSDRLLLFNPYRVADRPLLECAERGRWSPFPSVTQMLVFHFHDICRVKGKGDNPGYRGLFFHIGDTDKEYHFGLGSLTYPLAHPATKGPVWMLINGAHLVNSNIQSLEGKSVFVSHALQCDRAILPPRQSYRMHRLYGSEAHRAKVVRESMCQAKLTMLEEIMKYPILPHYLGNLCKTFDYITPLRQAIDSIRRYPAATTPTTHIIG